MTDLKGKTLDEVLSTLIGKYVKIGGKAGFMFCGYINSNYKEMITDLLQLKADQTYKLMIKAKEENNFIADRYKNNPKKTVLSEKEIDNQIEYNNQKIEKYKEQYKTTMQLLDAPVSDIYKSTIDEATIVIVKTNINGSGTITCREDMYKYPLYRSLVNKYSI